MGGAVDKCLRSLFSESDADKQRRFELSVVGIPGSLKVKYEVGELLFSGTHGEIFSVTEASSGRKLAMKAYWKNKRSFQYLDVWEYALAIPELRQCKLRHDNIMRYMEFFESLDLFCCIFENWSGGSLYSLLQRKLQFDEKTVAKLFAQCVEGIAYLHRKKIIHRDLRLDQFLLTQRKLGKVKLGDLMHCARAVDGGKIFHAVKPVVLIFAAPETLVRGEYTMMSDMWQIGGCLYELYFGYPAFGGEGKALGARIMSEPAELNPVFATVSRGIQELLGSLLSKDPHARLTVEKVTTHKWFANAEKNAVLAAKAAQQRRRTLEASIEAMNAVVLARQKKEEEEKLQAIVIRSQFSRTLTDDIEQLSLSTLSDNEGDEDLDGLDLEGMSAEETDDEDFKIAPDRSDLESIPHSGDHSHSDTYVNSDQGWCVRTAGDWDEFDSEFFEEDRKGSSLWSEAEYSDWTIEGKLAKEANKDWNHWADSFQPGILAELVQTKAKYAGDHEGSEGSGWSNGEGEEEEDDGSGGWKSSGSDDGDRKKTKKKKKKTDGWGGSEDSWDHLERSARSRENSSWGSGSGSGSAAGSAARSATSSAPWEYGSNTERSEESSGSSGQKARKQKRAPQQPLLPIYEDGKLGDPAPKDSIAMVTNRCIAEQNAPWDQNGPALPRGQQSTGMIIMSKRSNSSSGSGTQRSLNHVVREALSGRE